MNRWVGSCKNWFLGGYYEVPTMAIMWEGYYYYVVDVLVSLDTRFTVILEAYFLRLSI